MRVGRGLLGCCFIGFQLAVVRMLPSGGEGVLLAAVGVTADEEASGGEGRGFGMVGGGSFKDAGGGEGGGVEGGENLFDFFDVRVLGSEGEGGRGDEAREEEKKSAKSLMPEPALQEVVIGVGVVLNPLLVPTAQVKGARVL